MDVFALRIRIIDDYREYIASFLSIRDPRINAEVAESIDDGLLWPEPRIGLNPAFESGGVIDEHVASGLLHPECSNIFRIKHDDGTLKQPMTLHRHQLDAIQVAQARGNYVLTTGTGSGKNLSYIVPIVDRVLRNGSGNRRMDAGTVSGLRATCKMSGSECFHHGIVQNRDFFLLISSIRS